MDASLWVASLALFWLILLAFAWLKDKQNHIRIHEAQHKWLDSLSERLRDIEGRLGPDREDARNVITTQIADLEIRADEMSDHIANLRCAIKTLKDAQKVNDEEHRVLRVVLLAVSKHGKVAGLEEALGFEKEAQDARG